MIEYLIGLFSLGFVIRALVVGILISLCAALLGVSLVLKHYSMIGDGLSHVGFGALAVASAVNAAPLAVAFPIVIVTAFLLLRVSEKGRVKGDAAIALISAAALAVGVAVISKIPGVNTDLNSYLFGSIITLTNGDLYMSAALSLTVTVLFVLFYNRIFAVTFDETFMRATGLRTGFYNMLLALMTAVTIVLGMRMMGALLISSLIIFPALTSMRIFKNFRNVTVFSAVISVVCFIVGFVLSGIFETPVGASVVIANAAAFLLFWAISGIISARS